MPVDGVALMSDIPEVSELPDNVKAALKVVLEHFVKELGGTITWG